MHHIQDLLKIKRVQKKIYILRVAKKLYRIVMYKLSCKLNKKKGGENSRLDIFLFLFNEMLQRNYFLVCEKVHYRTNSRCINYRVSLTKKKWRKP